MHMCVVLGRVLRCSSMFVCYAFALNLCLYAYLITYLFAFPPNTFSYLSSKDTDCFKRKRKRKRNAKQRKTIVRDDQMMSHNFMTFFKSTKYQVPATLSLFVRLNK